MSIINAQDTLNQLQNNTSQINFQNSRKTLGSSRLDREGFIRLIMAQLQYQDPTNPQDSSQMLSQQLQLEQADQMKEMVTSNKFSQAGSMVGRQATLMDAPWDFNTNTPGQPEWDAATNSPKTITGVIESVRFDTSRGKALVKIGENYYDAGTIQQIDASITTDGQTDGAAAPGTGSS